MKITAEASEDEIAGEFGLRVKATRIAAGVTMSALAEQAGIGERTLARLEAGEQVTFATVLRVLRELHALETVDLLLPSRDDSPMQELVQSQKKTERKRASRRDAKKRKSGIVWGDEQ